MADQTADTTVRRAYQVYLYAVCFVTILVVVFGAAEAVYGLVRIAAPGTTSPSAPFLSDGGPSAPLSRISGLSSGERRAGVAQLIQSGLLAAAAFAAFRFHWQRSVELRADLERPAPSPEPAPVESPVPDAAPPARTRAPRKRAPRTRA